MILSLRCSGYVDSALEEKEEADPIVPRERGVLGSPVTGLDMLARRWSWLRNWLPPVNEQVAEKTSDRTPLSCNVNTRPKPPFHHHRQRVTRRRSRCLDQTHPSPLPPAHLSDASSSFVPATTANPPPNASPSPLLPPHPHPTPVPTPNPQTPTQAPVSREAHKIITSSTPSSLSAPPFYTFPTTASELKPAPCARPPTYNKHNNLPPSTKKPASARSLHTPRHRGKNTLHSGTTSTSSNITNTTAGTPPRGIGGKR